MIAEQFLFRAEGEFIRLPVWGHIPLSNPMKHILANPSFLRLKGIRQLSFSQQVYPGATHTRFEHSIGVYHLMKLILQRMVSNPLAENLQNDSFRFDEQNCRLLLATCLLHDIGHYPHAHVIEEQIPSGSSGPVFDHHENLAARFLHQKHPGFPTIAEILQNEWLVDPDDVCALISGTSKSGFGKLISGTLDPDKMDYLMRDAHHCNIPYGSIDIERLIESFVPDPERKRFAITEKGIAPLESLLFAKYMMMRNVYWHHTGRALSVMLRRLLQAVADLDLLDGQQLRNLFYDNADDRILFELKAMLSGRSTEIHRLLDDILQRRVYKRAVTIQPYTDGRPEKRWFAFASNNLLCRKKELEICRFLEKRCNSNLSGLEVLIDSPSSKDIFDYNDLRELRIYPTRSEHLHYSLQLASEYCRFDDFGESVFRSDFILSFERYTKKFRLLCREDLAITVAEQMPAIMDILNS
ncbi:MAG: HD domain-containing protein [Chlorobium sp.]|uniref:HD domain-containing protein n=1 Tax=Chlorobium sp. TaxID=1095 RepID=UPI0025BBE9A0|nr:HD domain-containing protein [Chlorobium sp.]MCF8215390.1 HD domain-containing protein [Chlorobium sp.]MCF8270228.1 HD domain-containing protein [Chlorobium sp.]MCF8286597.1 HD domain-containing protein [Chlorobium sp.]MCF8290196.1 HD domain-containing protein [Chlorobium sp.]MCF8384355.1 HD domain-containing protein [Chlorobium sp.]